MSWVLQLLQKVEAVLPQLRAQEAGNVLWACAKLSLNPDLAVPGLTAKLISTVAEDEFAVAQNLSNTVWAVATLTDAGQLAPVDLAVVSTMFTRFMAFVFYPLTERSANSQEVSNLLWAAATLNLRLEATVLHKLYAHLVQLIQHPVTQATVTSQAVSNALWAAATLELRLEALALDRLCAQLVQLVQQPSTKARVDGQVVANALWSFYKLRHSPEPARLSSLLAHFCNLFTLQGRQPKSQAISNVVLAMAGFGQSSHVVEDLAHRLLITDRADLVSQEVCNVIWSLAVLNVLDTATFRLFWKILLSRFHGQMSGPGVRQLYQALYKLQPPSYNLTWQQLRQEVINTLGPVHLDHSQQSPALHSMLQTLQLEHRQDVAFSGYTAEAVLRQKADNGSNLLLVILNAKSYLTNVPIG